MNEQWLPVYISLLTPIATLAVVMVGFSYNNNRLNDFGDRLNDHKSLLQTEIRAVDTRLSDFRDALRAEGEKHEANLARVESALLGKFADLDTRLSRIESQLNLR